MVIENSQSVSHLDKQDSSFMNHDFTIRYTPAFVFETTTRFCVRRFGLSGIFTFAVLWIVSILLYLLNDSEWLSIIFITIATILTILTIAVDIAYIYQALASVRKMNPPETQFIFLNDSLTCKNSIGKSTVNLSAFVKVWRFKRFYMLFFSANIYITLPVDQIPSEVLDETINHMRTQGVPVTQVSSAL